MFACVNHEPLVVDRAVEYLWIDAGGYDVEATVTYERNGASWRVVKVETTLPEVTVEPGGGIGSESVPMLGDDPGSLDRFRRVFASWDFSQFAR